MSVLKIKKNDVWESILAIKGEKGDPGDGDMNKSVYDTNNNGKVDEAESVAWSGVSDKPSTFPPTEHTHDSRYYTESEVDSALATKQDSLPQVINDKFLHTNASTGALEWVTVSSEDTVYVVDFDNINFSQLVAAVNSGMIIKVTSAHTQAEPSVLYDYIVTHISHTGSGTSLEKVGLYGSYSDGIGSGRVISVAVEVLNNNGTISSDFSSSTAAIEPSSSGSLLNGGSFYALTGLPATPKYISWNTIVSKLKEDEEIRKITVSTSDIGAGASLPTGELYFVYE